MERRRGSQAHYRRSARCKPARPARTACEDDTDLPCVRTCPSTVTRARVRQLETEGDRQAVPRADRWTDGSSCASQPPPFPERTHDRSRQSHRLKRHEDRRHTTEDHMTTCALVSAANAPARPSPANGTSLRTLRSFSKGGRNTDITLDAPVSNVMTTTSFGDPQGMPLSVGNDSGSWPRCRKNFVGGHPAPDVSPFNVFGRSCSGVLQPPGAQRRPEGRAALLRPGAGPRWPVSCHRNADTTLDAPVSNVLTTCFGRRPAGSAPSGGQRWGVPAVSRAIAYDRKTPSSRPACAKPKRLRFGEGRPEPSPSTVLGTGYARRRGGTCFVDASTKRGPSTAPPVGRLRSG
jgi:hypothetical protein